MIKAVIFDMDGLMFDTENMWGTFWEPTLKTQGLELVEGLIEETCGTAEHALHAILSRHYGEKIDTARLLRDFRIMGNEVFFSAPVPKKAGLDELMSYLKSKGIPMAVASSSDTKLVENNLRQNNILGDFDAIICGDKVKKSKPEPDIFYTAAKELGVKPSECLVLEDSYNGVRAGAKGGFITVMVPDLLPPTEEMQKLFTACYEDLFAVKEAIEKNIL